MLDFNAYLIFDTILSRLMFSSIFSVLIAIIIGSIAGLLARIISHHNQRAILPAIMGAFFGTMLIAMLPIWSTPGLSGGGGLGALTIIQMAIFLVPPGAVCGAVVGIICGLKLSQKRKKQVFLVMLALTYSIIAITIYTRFTFYCNSDPWRKQICEPQAMLLYFPLGIG
ncbi:hypothetical protein HCG51_34325 (plasmid) [Tolypothrix sp. PCC 7910]|uniref:hypothetical protein n=1 Tax=Tolypothrix sp. PCC 7910 TaxID=2099387 RepID=UPI001427A06C|nr:hypothetical protein [Tolypothrix sp. PCC 7910]QIR41763.1 hypothetical protein HCG51_34325 [Tolypothrix sp. PCC 7910]